MSAIRETVQITSEYKTADESEVQANDVMFPTLCEKKFWLRGVGETPPCSLVRKMVYCEINGLHRRCVNGVSIDD
jgi:hypothetical protein